MNKCAECNVRGMQLQYVSRMGGGGYNRAQRRYSTGVCRWCVAELNALCVDSRSSDRIYGFIVSSVRYQFEVTVKERETLGDTEVGRLDALFYWGEYKRLNPVMAGRVAAETEGYREGFNSVTP